MPIEEPPARGARIRSVSDVDGHLDKRLGEIFQFPDEPVRGVTINPREHGLFPPWQLMENRTGVFVSDGRPRSPYRLNTMRDEWPGFTGRAVIEHAVIYPTDALTFACNVRWLSPRRSHKAHCHCCTMTYRAFSRNGVT